jgi:spore coat protein U-like protein
MRTGYLIIAFITAANASVVPVLAQTSTTQFNVQITITSECVVNSATDLDFGATGVIDAVLNADSEIAVQCTNLTPYNIGLDAGSGASATVADRLMTGPASETVAYSLFSDAAHADVWGDTIGTDTVPGTGTGAQQIYPVYGRVPVQATPQPGAYTDTITVTLTY